jgi:quercetin dioxygenase-like cupin family protein
MRTGWMLAFLLSLLSLVAAGAAPSGDTPMAQNTGADKFQKIPGLPDCLTVAVEQGDPGKDASLLLVKTTAGCKVPWHFHTPNEQLMMVSGIGRVEMKDEQAAELRAGGFAYAPAKHVHQFTCVGRPCTFFLRSDAPFDTHYVDKNGSEISPDQALGKIKK